jgi:hypothetical protein
MYDAFSLTADATYSALALAAEEMELYTPPAPLVAEAT